VSTDTAGIACFTYTGLGGPGTDKIIAEFTDSHGVVLKSSEAKKIWYDPCPGDLQAGVFGVVCSSNRLSVGFSHPITAAVGGLLHYSLDHGFNITNATFYAGSYVALEADQNFVSGVTYTLQVSDVTNLCGEVINPNPFFVSFQC